MKIKCFSLFGTFCTVSLLQAQPVNQTSFEKSGGDETPFTLASWQGEGFNVPWVLGFNQNRAYVDDAYVRSGTKSLRIFYPKGTFGPQDNGAQAPLKVQPKLQYYGSYWVRFSDNFSWGTTSFGAKLPGLTGGKDCSGGQTCDGTNGFSTRIVWGRDGKASAYIYHMDKPGTYGETFALQTTPGTDFLFQKGKWYNIIMRTRINTASNHNGEVEVWIDQKQAILKTGLKFVTNGDQVDKLYFDTFHGGADANFAPTVDCYAWFDDILVTENPNDVFTNACGGPNTWVNTSFAQQTGIFTVDFDAIPTGNNMDGVVGLSDSVASVFTDLACIVRFNTNGNIDVRNASTYQATNTVPYMAGTSYHVKMDININTKKYDAFVTPAGGSQQTIAQQYDFRTEQISVAKLDNLSKNTVACAVDIKNFILATATHIPGKEDDFNIAWASPNPNTGTFLLNFHIPFRDDVTIRISSIHGQKVYEKTVRQFRGNYSEEIDISSLNKGVYFLSVAPSGHKQFIKIVLN